MSWLNGLLGSGGGKTLQTLFSGAGGAANPLNNALGLSGGKGNGGIPGLSQTAQQQMAGLIGGSTPVPNLQELNYEMYNPTNYATPEEIAFAGGYDPALLGQSEMQNVDVDKNILDAQSRALQQLSDVSSQGGMTAIDKARLADIQAEQLGTDKGQREAIMQGQAMRGMGDSGSTLAALLQGQQGSSNAANRNALDVNAQAQQRALQAMSQTGQLGTQMNQQQFGQRAAQAEAQDAINRFNNQNVNNAQARNTDVRQQLLGQNTTNRNQVSQMNTDLRNTAMGGNVDMRNQQQYYNRVTRPQSMFGMQSGNAQAVAAGVSNASNMGNQNRWNQANINQQDRAAALNTTGTIVGGVASGGLLR